MATAGDSPKNKGFEPNGAECEPNGNCRIGLVCKHVDRVVMIFSHGTRHKKYVPTWFA